MRIVDIKNGFDSSEIEKLVRAEEVRSSVDPAVVEILKDVRKRGDAALCDYSQRFDNFPLTEDSIRVTADEIGLHAAAAPPEMIEVLRTAIRNVREFHLQQRTNPGSSMPEMEFVWECAIARWLAWVSTFQAGPLPILHRY